VMDCDYSQREVYLYPQRQIIKRMGWSPAFGDEKVACGTKYLKDDESGMWLRCFTRHDLRLMGGESVMFFEERPAASVSNQYSSVAESISAMFQGESYPNGMIINLDERSHRVRNIRIYGPKSEIIAEWGEPNPPAYGQYRNGVIKVAADFKTDRSGVQCMSVKGKVICRFRTDNDGRIDPRFPIEPGGETKADWFGPRVIFSECGKMVRQLEVYHKGAVVGVWP